VVKVTGAHNARISLAALICAKPGQRPRLIYLVHTGRRQRHDRRKGFTKPITPGCWTLPTSSSAARWCWSGTA
jgi:hypothetical protein